MSTTAAAKGFESVKKHDISARDFYDAIMLALGQLGGFKPDRPVAHANAYDPIFATMGITREEYDKQDNTGAWWTERWVQEATKALVKKGWVTRPSRGMWALTPNGVSEAQRLDKAGVAPVKAPAKTATPKKTAPKLVPTPTPAPAADGVSLPVSAGLDEACYHADPYIRSLGVQTSACLGAFSETAPKCDNCPVQTMCINAMAAELSRLAAELSGEDKAAELAAAQPKAPAAPATVAPAAAPKAAKAKASTKATHSGPARDIRCQQPAICAKCGGTMPKGTPAKWVRSADGGSPGIFHPHCYEDK